MLFQLDSKELLLILKEVGLIQVEEIEEQDLTHLFSQQTQ